MAHALAEARNHTEEAASTLMGNVNNVFLAGLGVVASTQEKSREVFDRLIDKGKVYQSDDTRLLFRATHEVQELGQQLEERIQRTVSSTLHRAGIPSRDEIHELIKRMESLTRKVDKLATK